MAERIVAIIQARIGSARLPGKVLQSIGKKTMLERVVARTEMAKKIDDVVVATTTEPADDLIEEFSKQQNWLYFRGSQDDVLDRYYQAALAYGADVVVRITSDCPLLEPEIVDCVVKEFLVRQPEVDYASNFLPHRTFPRGLDTEVMRFDVLARVWQEDDNPVWREHVTPYIQGSPDLFSIHGVTNDVDYSHMRWTVDTLEDLAFVRRIYDYFGQDHFSWREVLAVLEKHPAWLGINQHIRQKVI